MDEEIGELPALLDEMLGGQIPDFLVKGRNAERFAQNLSRVLKAQRLVEIAQEQEFLGCA